MKKVAIVIVMFLFFFTPQSFALDWAYSFVVWKGDVYIVSHPEIKLTEQQVGKKIGMVRTKANEYTGGYYGNASNTLDRGTPYYEIIDVKKSDAIAIFTKGEYIMAEYSHPARFHIMNVMTNPYFLSFITIVVIALVIKKRKVTSQK